MSDSDSVESAELFVRRNQETAHAWDLFEPHRARVMQLIQNAASKEDGILHAFGAGNINDLDLVELANRFANIHLFDIDAAALESGMERQLGESDCRNKVCVHQADLNGLAEIFSSGTLDSLDSSALNQVRAILDGPVPPVSTPANVTISLCVFSQMIDAFTRWAGGLTAQTAALLSAFREQHLRKMLAHSAPGGTCVFVCDLVSSATWPDIEEIPDEQFPAACGAQINRQNFFAGTNPAVWNATLRSASFADQVETVQISEPWRWNPGPRVYAVFAAVFQRKQ